MSTALNLSLEQQVALLPEDQQEAVLEDLDINALPWDWDWSARPSQKLPIEPVGQGQDWAMALINAGRGFGKTRSGGEWIKELDKRWYDLGRDPGQDLRVALLGRTAADVRDTILNGESGLLNIYPPSERDKVEWISSQRRVNLPGGGFCLCFSAEEPDQLRGPQFHVGWGDEMAAYKQVRGEGNLDAWTNLRIAVRLGLVPQVLGTTTPKRVKLLRELIAEIQANPDTMILRRGRTADNIHLAESYKATLMALYAGTTLGAQELEGEMLDAVAGATVDIGPIEDNRVTALPTGIPRWVRLIAVDPSVAEKPRDLCGIVVIYAPLTYPVVQRHAYVVDDLSVKGSPTVWGDVVIRAAIRHRAAIIVENNQGGALVRRNLAERASAWNAPVPVIREVWSSKSKQIRAENIGAAYQRGRVHHLNVLADLEDQLTSWTPDDKGYSPDRLDADVHGLSAVLFPDALVQGGVPGATTSHTPVGTGRIARQTELVARNGGNTGTVIPLRPAQRLPGSVVGVPGVLGQGLVVPRRTVPAKGTQ